LVQSLCLIAAPVVVRSESPIRTFGERGGTSFSFVQRGDRISIYAERVAADFILDELRAVGGPTYASLEPLTRPVTLTLHGVSIETMLRRMLEGYNYSLHYENGRLAHVRVLHMMPGRGYKVTDAIETLSEWTRIELAGHDARTEDPDPEVAETAREDRPDDAARRGRKDRSRAAD
jgi:hypothetical protein